MKVILISLLLVGLVWGAAKPAPKPKLNCECGKRNAGRIFAGKATRKNEYPWMAALVDEDKDHFCGGSIITERHILTAAHCIYGVEAEDIEVVLAGYDLTNLKEPNSQRLKVERIILHETYSNTTARDDIAILVTATKIIYNQNVGPVCMPIEPLKNNLTGQVVKAMGWGLIEKEDTPESLKKLREVDLDVTNINCPKAGMFHHICTFRKGKDVCTGDSGGPLVWLHPTTNRFTQVALVSYGWDDECGVVTGPGRNTDVSAYLDWINLQIKPLANEAKTCHEI